MYEEYLAITLEEKALKAKKEILKGKMLDDLKDKPGQKNDLGFKISHRKSYTYSESTTNLADDLKEVQLDEVEQGIATISKDTEFITAPR